MSKYLQGTAPVVQFDENNRIVWKFDYEDYCSTGVRPQIELADDVGEQLLALGGIRVEE